MEESTDDTDKASLSRFGIKKTNSYVLHVTPDEENLRADWDKSELKYPKKRADPRKVRGPGVDPNFIPPLYFKRDFSISVSFNEEIWKPRAEYGKVRTCTS